MYIMFEEHSVEISWGERELRLDTGLLARQADGAVLVSYGATRVLCTAVYARTPRENVNFLPLTVNYQEKTFAAGKIPGGFFRREGRPGEKETLTSRLIDRPLRPLFSKGYRCETQIVCTVLEHDLQNDADIPSLIGASAALHLSGAPLLTPIAAARIGWLGGKPVLNPTLSELGESELDLVLAGTANGIMMVESEAKELNEEQMLEALTFGQSSFAPVLAAIQELGDKARKPAFVLPPANDALAGLEEKMTQAFGTRIQACYEKTKKAERVQALEELRTEVTQAYAEFEDDNGVKEVLKGLEKDLVRKKILTEKVRIDARGLEDIRALDCRAGYLARTHGSALFTRGETQALAVATLGTPQDSQIVDALAGEYREHFMLHYNFPPYSVGEASMMRPPGRREIGHGKLAWRALRPLMPSKDDFAYTVRVVSEITESNGSSSMATVCASSLALMDAGVPLRAACAGIAMGLIKEGEDFAILSDILGDEDHLGDMDFKVAGSEKGITALQMDIKIEQITLEIMRQALAQAERGRKHILSTMSRCIDQPRDSLSEHAPRMRTIKVPKDKIRDVIGAGGKVIRELCESTGARIDIDDDGTVRIAAVEERAIEAAVEKVEALTASAQIGKIYKGKVVRIMDFGAFVNFLGGKDGLVHISEIANHRIGRVSDVLSVGDEVTVKCLRIDEQGRVGLSIRATQEDGGDEGGGGGGGAPREQQQQRYGEEVHHSPYAADEGERRGGYGDRRGSGGDRRGSGGDRRGSGDDRRGSGGDRRGSGGDRRGPPRGARPSYRD